MAEKKAAKKAARKAPAKKASAKKSAAKKGAARKAAPRPAAKKAAAGKAPARKPAAKPATATDPAVARDIDGRIKEIGGWRGETLGRLRALIHEADPEVVEEIKWRKPSNPDGVPVWSHEGMICTGEVYKDHVRLTFPQGSAIRDPRKVFNSGFEGVRRALLVREGEKVDEEAFRDIIRDAVAINARGRAR